MKKLFYLFLISSIYLLTFLIGLTHYDSTNSPDFARYFYSYNSYYVGELNQTGLEQGNLYFYLVSWFISIGNHLIINPYLSEYLNYKIQLLNFFIFVIGSVFIYLYLIEINVRSKVRILILLAINFFPPLFALRLIYKPEILLFSLFFIALFLIEKNRKTDKSQFLYLFSICIALMLSIKLVSAGILILFLTILSYKKNRYNFIKIYKKIILIFTLFFLILTYENFLINGNLFFEHKTPVEFEQKAEVSFLYTLDIKNLYFNPYQHNFKNSAIGIILLESFDDYFHIYWNNDKSVFNVGQIKFSNMQFIIQYISILLTFIFYSLITVFSFIFKQYRIQLLSPYLGILSLLIVSFFIQFNPNTGDQIKTYYYSSLLVLAFIYLIIIASKYFKFRILILLLVIQIFTASYIVGFPKEYSLNMETKIIDQLITTNFCNLLEHSIDFPNNNQCIDVDTVCNLGLSYNLSPEFKSGKWYFKLYKPPESLIMINNNNNLVNVENIEECQYYTSIGYKLFNKSFYLNNQGPLFSIITFVVLVFLSFYKRKIKNYE